MNANSKCEPKVGGSISTPILAPKFGAKLEAKLASQIEHPERASGKASRRQHWPGRLGPRKWVRIFVRPHWPPSGELCASARPQSAGPKTGSAEPGGQLVSLRLTRMSCKGAPAKRAERTKGQACLSWEPSEAVLNSTDDQAATTFGP